MQNLVLIPCWRRDDFLAVTLEHIVNANRADQYCYIFLVDRGFSPNVLGVIESFPLCKDVRIMNPHRYIGNSYNVLEGYKYALELTPQCESELIYLIEEDIWVGKDFFDFHETVQSQYSPFCLSGVRCQNDPTQYEQNPAAVYHHHTFQSLGLSWKPKNLKLVADHAKPEYYRNMKGYIRAMAPNSKYGTSWSEQDGLINRLVEVNNVQCMYPYVGRAYHAGFVGYNRRGRPLEGSLEERVQTLKTMSKEDMNERAIEYKDIESIDCSIDHGVKEFILKGNALCI